jgi:hypothetical protein
MREKMAMKRGIRRAGSGSTHLEYQIPGTQMQGVECSRPALGKSVTGDFCRIKSLH